jgi:transposase
MISDAQRKRFFAIAKQSGYTDEEIKSKVYTETGQESTKLIQVDKYEDLCEWAAQKGVEPEPPAEEWHELGD